MEQIGEVVEIQGSKALVRIQRASACGENCAQCEGGCKPTSTVVKANNSISAKVGDTVKIEMNSLAFMSLAFIGYILPIIICIATYFTVNAITDSIVIADTAAILSLVIVLVLFYILDKFPWKTKAFTTEIVKVLK